MFPDADYRTNSEKVFSMRLHQLSLLESRGCLCAACDLGRRLDAADV